MDGHYNAVHELFENKIRRGGRRGPDGWTHLGLVLVQDLVLAAEADAALMDGHDTLIIDEAHHGTAAEADAALMDGHAIRPKTAFEACAAEADAALMDGHWQTSIVVERHFPPRRPTRP